MELNQQRQCSQRQDCVFDYETARTICSLDRDVGSCRGIYKRFFYDPVQQECQEFDYGGCRGNQNNFLTRETCMNTCSVIRATVPVNSDIPENLQSPITPSPRALTQNVSRSNSLRVENLPVDCVLSEWSEWGTCHLNGSCGIEN